MKNLILALSVFASVSTYASDVIVDKKSYKGQSKIDVFKYDDGTTGIYLYTTGKPAEVLFETLDKNRHAAKVRNPGLDERWLGEGLACLKFLNEGNRVLCSQQVMEPTHLK